MELVPVRLANATQTTMQPTLPMGEVFRATDATRIKDPLDLVKDNNKQMTSSVKNHKATQASCPVRLASPVSA